MADGKVKSVSVVFQAFTDKFEKGTNRASKKISGFAKKAAGVAAGFIAGRAAINSFRKQLEKLDRLGKLSDRMDIDPNTLRGMDLAATQLGTSFEQVEKGIQRMSRTIGEARQGITTGTTALKDLGLSADDFDGLNVEQQYKMIADRVAAIEDPAQKAAVAFRIFGRSGQEMLNMLNLGADGLEKFKQEAEELGGPISRDDLKQIELANDAVDKMGRAWEGIMQQLAIEFAPLLQDLADMMKELVGWVKVFGDAWKFNQGIVEDFFSIVLHGGEGMDIELGGGPDFKAKDLKSPLKPAEIQKTTRANLKSFSEGAQFQSSKAFDILNPNRAGSVQKQQLSELQAIKDAVQKQADSKKIELVQQEI